VRKIGEHKKRSSVRLAEADVLGKETGVGGLEKGCADHISQKKKKGRVDAREKVAAAQGSQGRKGARRKGGGGDVAFGKDSAAAQKPGQKEKKGGEINQERRFPNQEGKSPCSRKGAQGFASAPKGGGVRPLEETRKLAGEKTSSGDAPSSR